MSAFEDVAGFGFKRRDLAELYAGGLICTFVMNEPQFVD